MHAVSILPSLLLCGHAQRVLDSIVLWRSLVARAIFQQGAVSRFACLSVAVQLPSAPASRPVPAVGTRRGPKWHPQLEALHLPLPALVLLLGGRAARRAPLESNDS